MERGGSTAESGDGGAPWGDPMFGVAFELELSADGAARFERGAAGMAEAFGLDPQSLSQSAQPWFAALHPDDASAARAALAGAHPWSQEFRILSAGSERWFKARAQRRALPGGAIRWSGQMIESTACKNLERDGARAARMLSLIADASADAMFVAEPAGSGADARIALPYVSAGVGAVFGVEPREAMADGYAIWNLFDPQERMKGFKAFERARSEGRAQEELSLVDGQGRRRAIGFALAWSAPHGGSQGAWTGRVEVVEPPAQALERVWMAFASEQEERFGAPFLDGFAEALRRALGAKSARAEWFDEPLLALVDEGLEVQWSARGARIAVVDDKRAPVGDVEIEWEDEAPARAEPTLRRAAALARAHWNARHHEWAAESGLNAALADLERSAGLASMGSLVGGIAHDLSSPLGNGALSGEVVRLRALKLTDMLAQEKVKRSELAQLSAGLAEVAKSALEEIDKARSLLDAFKKIAQEQLRGGQSKHELGALLADMRSSLHPTLRKRGVELELAPGRGEIWARVEVAEMFNWLVKCAMAATWMDKGAFAPKARLELRLKFESGQAGLELALLDADAKKVEEALGTPLESDHEGTPVARYPVGPAMAGWETAPGSSASSASAAS